MTEESQKPPRELSFSEHFSEQVLHNIEVERLPPFTPAASLQRVFLVSDPCICSRFLFWSTFSGLFVPTSDGTVNLEKHFMLRADYTEKSNRHQSELQKIESSDFENPLSRDYKLCFEMEMKNQIKIDILRTSFLRETIHKNSATLFRLLYTWSLENAQIGYRQGLLN